MSGNMHRPMHGCTRPTLARRGRRDTCRHDHPRPVVTGTTERPSPPPPVPPPDAPPDAQPDALRASGPVYTTREIEALIPHRWPFLLVDRIVEYDPEHGRIVGVKAVAATEWYFQGHFPGLPVMPGVLQVEALAQTMAVYVAEQAGLGEGSRRFAGHQF